MTDYVYVIADTTRDKVVRYLHRTKDVTKFLNYYCTYTGDNTEDYMIRIYDLNGNIKYITADDWLRGNR